MKKLLLGATLLCAINTLAQPIVNSWVMNVNGKVASQYGNNGGMPPSWTFVTMTDSADVLSVCYNADTVWVRSNDLTDNMGKWQNPGSAVAQNTTHRFPRTPVVPATPYVSPKVGEIGVLTNGIMIYGLGDAYSWNGTTNTQMGGAGIWNREVGLGEGVSLDTAFGAHPQNQGIYHSHTTPYRLYKNVATSTHSPIIGWAFDGYPIYGPYGYSSANDATSAVARMKSGYSLRNITTRTTYSVIPGGGGPTSQAGPAVSATYPIGTYCEDYEWLASNGGDLDENNGRTCVTPEFPGGTYAYFVTVDAVGKAVFPYYIGLYYHGKPDTKNYPAGPMAGNGITTPTYLSSCRLPVGTVGIGEVINKNAHLEVFPNPALDGSFAIKGNNHRFVKVTVINMYGQVIYVSPIKGGSDFKIHLNTPGIYFVRCDDATGGTAEVQRIVVD